MKIGSCNLSYTAENRYKINNSSVYLQTKPLTNRWVKGFDAAKQAITQTEGKHQRQLLGAAIFHGNRLLSTGYNIFTKTKPGNTVTKANGKEYSVTAHAEQVAVDGIKHYGYENLKLIIYVVRVNSENSFVTSRPCNMCIDYLRKYGIRIVRFINEHGLPEQMML